MREILELQNALGAIQDGYDYTIEYFPNLGFNLVLVENPEYEEDNGRNVYLGFKVTK